MWDKLTKLDGGGGHPCLQGGYTLGENFCHFLTSYIILQWLSPKSSQIKVIKHITIHSVTRKNANLFSVFFLRSLIKPMTFP